MCLSNVAQSVYGSYFIFSGDNDLTLSPASDVDQVNTFLRKDMQPDDLIFASTQILWSLPGRKADPVASIYFDDPINAKNLNPLGRERFAYSQSIQSSKYVVLDPLAKEFSPRAVVGFDAILEKVEKWPMVFKSGNIEVYKNPQVIPTTQ
jgi:hypothetical protein